MRPCEPVGHCIWYLVVSYTNSVDSYPASPSTRILYIHPLNLLINISETSSLSLRTAPPPTLSTYTPPFTSYWLGMKVRFPLRHHINYKKVIVIHCKIFYSEINTCPKGVSYTKMVKIFRISPIL